MNKNNLLKTIGLHIAYYLYPIVYFGGIILAVFSIGLFLLWLFTHGSGPSPGYGGYRNPGAEY